MITWQIGQTYHIVNNQYCAIAGSTLIPIYAVQLCSITCVQASFTIPGMTQQVNFPTTVGAGDNNILPDYFAAFETHGEAETYYNEILLDMKNNLDAKILAPK